MAKAQVKRFSESQQELAGVAKALSHPARVAILEVLASKNVCLCGEVVEEFPLSQATVSQHLKVLKEAGLVQGEVEGPRSCYCVDWNGLTRAGSVLREWLERAATLKNECCK